MNFELQNNHVFLAIISYFWSLA